MSGQQGRGILLVEDEVIIALDQAQRLSEGGYRVKTVHSGEDAVQAAAGDSDIELVLMDIDLGDGIDGTEAATRILTERSLPIVFLTSHSEQSMVERVRNITRYGYVLKSSGDFVLLSSIEMAFDLFKAHERLLAQEAQLARAQSVARIGSWEFDFNTMIVNASAEARRIYGLKQGTLSIPDVQEVPLPEYREVLDTALRDLMAGRAAYDVRFRIRRPNDAKIREIHSVAEYDGRINRVIGIIQDVTETARTEQALERRKQLEHAVAQMSQILMLGSSRPDTVPRAIEHLRTAAGLAHVAVFRNRSELGRRLAPVRGHPIRDEARELPADVKATRGHHEGSALCVPYFVEGKWAGFILLVSHETQRFEDADVSIYKTAADLIGAHFERRCDDQL